MGYCSECGNTEPKPLMAKLCLYHYKLSKTNKPIVRKPVNIATSRNTPKLETISDLLKTASITFNRWIKERDKLWPDGAECLSCGMWFNMKHIQAGHFMPGTISALKFNEDNVHAECENCNCHDPNHLIGYRKNLINKIGLKKVEWLESHKIGNIHKWNRQELLDIIEKYKAGNN